MFLKFTDMVSSITRGVKVTVESFYQSDYSSPLNGEFMFAYRINIINESQEIVKLLRRHWFIIDSNGLTREVEGEGVVGQQPILEQGEQYEYVSGCNLKTEIGKMYGSYLMERATDKRQFYVNIPEFKLVAPQKLN